jgi:hypothetical protein
MMWRRAVQPVIDGRLRIGRRRIVRPDQLFYQFSARLPWERCVGHLAMIAALLSRLLRLRLAALPRKWGRVMGYQELPQVGPPHGVKLSVRRGPVQATQARPQFVRAVKPRLPGRGTGTVSRCVWA